jgi:hypothetical protein
MSRATEGNGAWRQELNAEVLRHGFMTGDATLVRPSTEAGFSEVEHMRNSISRTIVAGLAALAMSAAVILPATPASAAYRFGSGGWAGGRVWHSGYWRGGYWSNGWWAPAVAAGLLTGAAIATYPGATDMVLPGVTDMVEAAAGSIGRFTTDTATLSANAG